MGSQRAEHDRATKHSTHGIYTWFPSVSTNSQVAQLVHSVCQCRRCKRCWYDPGRSPGEGNGNPLQYSCLENPHGQRNLAGYRPLDSKESDTTERLSTQRVLLKSVCRLSSLPSLFYICSSLSRILPVPGTFPYTLLSFVQP